MNQPGGVNQGGQPLGGEEAGGEEVGGSLMAGMMMQGGAVHMDPLGGMPAGGVDLEGGMMMGGMEDTSNMEISLRYDGTYIAAFNSEGLKTALAQVRIEDGYINGDVLNRFGERFTMQGFIDQNGVLRIPPLIGDMGSIVNAEGRVAISGIIEGTYLVGNREGSFAGSLDNLSLIHI